MSKIVVWDFSWIQNYLFDIRKNKSATKRLKWRSTFIEILLEKIKEDLKNSWVWEIKDDYLLSWWKFVLIFNSFDEEKFKEFKKKIEEKLFKQFYGELKILFWVADLDDNGKIFKEALNKAYEDAEKNKLKAFASILNENWGWKKEMFVFDDDRGPSKVCKFSRDRLIDDDMTKIIKEEFWENFFDETNKWISYEAWLDLLITKWITKWEFKDENKVELIKDYKPTKVNLIDEIKNRQNLLKWVPVFTEEEIELFKKELLEEDFKDTKAGDIKSFEALSYKLIKENEIKRLKKWFNKLAVLKWDIDNLWEIFQFDLKEDGYYENYKKLSKILDNFWKKELYNLIWEKDIYVVYAGWDDFVILWRWNVIIEFYKDLLELFKSYIWNEKYNDDFNYENWIEIELNWEEEKVFIKDLLSIPDNYEGKSYKIVSKLHFSSAIKLFWSHDTFFTIIKQTEKLLEEAKSWDKNQVNIFWKVLSNDEFIKLFEEARRFKEEFIENDVVSSWTLMFFLDIARKIMLRSKFEERNDPLKYITWKSEVFYHLGRNYKTQKWGDKKDKFREYMNWMLLWNWVSEFKSLGEDNKLFWDYKNWELYLKNDVGEKLFIMMSLCLYWKRDK